MLYSARSLHWWDASLYIQIRHPAIDVRSDCYATMQPVSVCLFFLDHICPHFFCEFAALLLSLSSSKSRFLLTSCLHSVPDYSKKRSQLTHYCKRVDANDKPRFHFSTAISTAKGVILLFKTIHNSRNLFHIWHIHALSNTLCISELLIWPSKKGL